MITRSEIMRRAATWLADGGVPYSQTRYTRRPPALMPVEGWRADCSGYVSMAWALSANRWTGNLAGVATPIAYSQLERGDMLLYHNPSNPSNGSHVVLFDRWDGPPATPGGSHRATDMWIYEQTPPHTLHRRWPASRNMSNYRAYRYNNLAPDPIPGRETAMPALMGRLDGRSTVWYTPNTEDGHLRSLRKGQSVDALHAAGVTLDTFADVDAMLETMGWVRGDTDGTVTRSKLSAAG